ncbi:peptide-methionine (R)-S-oxide reductase MsrB [Spongorhabdus nitratireducens]
MMKVKKSEAQWREELTDEQFRVCRQSGTEIPFSGEYAVFDRNGVYHCVCCNQVLFDSTTKFDAGCGWPSFWQTVDPDAVIYIEDHSHGMHRTEVRCANCEAHLGHVFPDGPHPTGNRYCMNSVALSFKDGDNTSQ